MPFGLPLRTREDDRRRIRRRIVGELGLPVGRDLAGRLGDGVDIAFEGKRHDVGVEAVDDGAGLGAGTAMRSLDRHRFTAVLLPLGGKGGIEILI